jgi:glycosyltransferase involved in cell wall biosynthesis
MLNCARKLIGEAAHALDLTEELTALGHDVQLVLRDNCDLLTKARARELPIALTLQNAGGFHPIHSVRELWSLRRLVLDYRPDVMHCHRGKDHGLAAAVIKTIPRRLRPCIVRTRHRVVPVHNTVANRWLYVRNTHGVISVSARAAQSFGTMIPMLKDKMSIVYSAVDSTKFNPLKRSALWRENRGVLTDEPLIGLIARLQRVKGQRPFMQAAAKVLEKYPHAKFLVAGPGPDGLRAKLKAYGEELGIAHRLIMESWLDDIHAATASLDIGVLASLGSEASSRIVYEYMSSGVPVVATSVGCIPELLATGEVGLMVPPGDPDAMADAILKALDSQELRTEMSQRAREYIELRHSRKRWVSEIVDAYEMAIKRRFGVITPRPGTGGYRLVITGKLDDAAAENSI